MLSRYDIVAPGKLKPSFVSKSAFTTSMLKRTIPVLENLNNGRHRSCPFCHLVFEKDLACRNHKVDLLEASEGNH